MFSHATVYILIGSVSICLLSVSWKMLMNSDQSKQSKTFHTQHWCSGSQCHFRSLCYFPTEKQFLYILSKGSHLNYIEMSFRDVSLSSVSEVNTFSFRPTFVNSDLFGFTILWEDKPALFLWRYKPDNLMHVFHDDILPLYHTVNFLGHSDLNIVLIDQHNPGPFSWLYQAIAEVNYISGHDWQANDILCYRHSYIGVSSLSKWYQYGYETPQGPINNQILTSHHLRPPISLFQNQTNPMQNSYIVFLSRTDTRVIINEHDLITSLSSQTGLKIVTLRDEDIIDMIDVVSASSGIIGMHGALLILGLFLKPGSVMIELFPYAVNPENYTPYKTLASIPGMLIVYKSWRNMDRTMSIFHPEYSQEEGGVGHMSLDDQLEIRDQKEVPPHLCCNDPSWLHHIYQDTVVNIEEVVSLVQQAYLEARNLDHKIFLVSKPSNVKDITCECGDNKLKLRWGKPWNLKLIQFESLHYKIVIENSDTQFYKHYLIDSCSYEIIDIKCDLMYNIWVNAIVDNSEGPFQYKKC